MRPTGIALVALSLLPLVGCSGPSGDNGYDGTEEASENFDYAEMDRWAEEDIRSDSSAEARAWLVDPETAIFEGDKAEVFALTNAFYDAGCPRVYITGIETFGDTELSASMVVVLPSDPGQRRAAFEIENEFSERYGADGYRDRGQKYMVLAFD